MRGPRSWLRRPPPPDVVQTLLHLRLADAIGWIVDRAEPVRDVFEVEGWALPGIAGPQHRRFLLNGAPFAELDWPRPSPDVAAFFPSLPFADNCRFVARQPLDNTVFAADGYASLIFAGPDEPHSRSYRRAVYVLDPALEPPVPDLSRIARVIQADAVSYRNGGASLAKRLDAYLSDHFSRPLADFSTILDWGCGAGRLTRHLLRLCRGQITGIDIDPDNIGWCAAAFPGARFAVGPLQPPLACDSGAFDLVIAISVFTHLDEETQFRWLAELHRVLRPGGLLLASIQGLAQLAFYKAPTDFIREVQTSGLVVSGRNDQLDAVISDREYYRNTTHSHDYVLRRWSEHFEICDIIEGIAANQDLVVLRRPA